MSSSSRPSPSPAVLLKLLVLEDEREMLLRLLHSFSFTNGLHNTSQPERRRNSSIYSSAKVSVSIITENTYTVHLLGNTVKLISDLSLFGQISGELGLDEVSDLTSCECANISVVL